MLFLHYYINHPVNMGTEDNPLWEDNLTEKRMTYSEGNEEIAKREAYKGEYTVEDDGRAEVPTQLDVIEAQVAYTALMTGTLLEV